MSNIKVASRYAKALFSLTEEQGELAQVRSNLKFIYQSLLSHNNLKKTMLNPLVSSKIKKTILEEILDKCQTTPSIILKNFLNLLAIKNRFEALKEICEEFEEKLLNKENKQKATVYSAQKLDEDQLANLSQQLKKTHSRQFILSNVVDPNLLAGIRIKIKDKILDYSIKSQLDALSKQMLKEIN